MIARGAKLSENEKQETEQRDDETAGNGDRELGMNELDDVSGGGIIVHDTKRTGESAAK
jgi:hypothetical protein